MSVDGIIKNKSCSQILTRETAENDQQAPQTRDFVQRRLLNRQLNNLHLYERFQVRRESDLISLRHETCSDFTDVGFECFIMSTAVAERNPPNELDPVDNDPNDTALKALLSQKKSGLVSSFTGGLLQITKSRRVAAGIRQKYFTKPVVHVSPYVDGSPPSTVSKMEAPIPVVDCSSVNNENDSKTRSKKESLDPHEMPKLPQKSVTWVSDRKNAKTNVSDLGTALLTRLKQRRQSQPQKRDYSISLHVPRPSTLPTSLRPLGVHLNTGISNPSRSFTRHSSAMTTGFTTDYSSIAPSQTTGPSSLIKSMTLNDQRCPQRLIMIQSRHHKDRGVGADLYPVTSGLRYFGTGPEQIKGRVVVPEEICRDNSWRRDVTRAMVPTLAQIRYKELEAERVKVR